jgi:Na+/melibiose symporter-like transporter
LQCDALFSHLNHLYLTALLPSNRIEPRQYSKTITTMLLRYLPFAPSTTPLQALTYLLGISLFSISFLVFLNSSISFVITDLIGQKEGVGDVVGTLGFADELVALVACPGWGLVSDRLGVRWVAVIGYAIIGLSLALFVQATNVYPQLLLARVLFAVGASAAATMVTAILPSLTDDSNSEEDEARARIKALQNATARSSIAFSVESEATITQERYTQSVSERSMSDSADSAAGRPSKLAGFVGLFTGCGALVALTLFLPLPAKFGEDEDTTPAEAVSYSFYVVAVVAFAVSLFVAIGLRNIKGEEGKGFRVLFGLKDENESASRSDGNGHQQRVSQVHLSTLYALTNVIETGTISTPYEGFGLPWLCRFTNRSRIRRRFCRSSIQCCNLTFHPSFCQHILH